MSSAAANFIRNVISKNSVALFSKSYCPYCNLAKEVLSEAGAREKAVIELDQRKDGDEIQLELTKFTGQSTVPHIFIDEKFIGGCTDVQKLQNDGKLKDVLSKL